MLTAYFWLTVLALLLLLGLLWRSGSARPLTVWGLTALVPLLVGLTLAMRGQAQAAATLQDYQPRPTAVVIRTGGQEYDTTLDGRQAACLERTLRLHTEADFQLAEGLDPLPIRKDTSLSAGQLPPRAIVEALSLRGQLHCPDFEPLKQEE